MFFKLFQAKSDVNIKGEEKRMWFQTAINTAFSNHYQDPLCYHQYAQSLHREDLALELVQIFFLYYSPRKLCRVLDLGAGSGILAECFLKHYPRAQITATDLDSNMLHFFSKRISSRIYSNRLVVAKLDMNAGAVEWKRKVGFNRFDLVTTLWCNRYITDLDQFLDNVWNSLKVNGFLVWPIFCAETLLWQWNTDFPKLVFWPNLLQAVQKNFKIIDILSSQLDSQVLLRPVYIVAQKSYVR